MYFRIINSLFSSRMPHKEQYVSKDYFVWAAKKAKYIVWGTGTSTPVSTQRLKLKVNVTDVMRKELL